MLEDIKNSRVYANALFKVSHNVKSIEVFNAQLLEIQNAWSASSKLIKFINSPIHSSNSRLAFITSVLSDFNFYKEIENLLVILVTNLKLNLVTNIVDEYFKLYRSYNNEKLVTVISTNKITNAQKSTITKSLENSIKKKVILENTVDHAILGGLIIKIDSLIIDHSVINKLNNLQLAITHN